MPTPFNLFEALNAYQGEAESICAASTANPGLVPNCCFDTKAGNVYISIEVRKSAGELVCTALGADPLADLARQLGVTYPVQYATNAQKERLKRLLDAASAPAGERTTRLLGMNRYTWQELEDINADLTLRAGHAAACEAQRAGLSEQNRLAA